MRALYRGLVEVRALKAVPRGLEACWVATAIGLEEQDFAAEGVADYLKALGVRTGNGAASVKDVRGGLGEAFQGSAYERALCSVGAAAALWPAGGVAMVYVEGLSAKEWTRVLTLGAELPLVVVALPGKDVPKAAGVPVIPVDAADVVALYRVAQESLVRARADGQAAVIECVATGLDPVALMGAQLVAKGICTAKWLAGVESGFAKVLAAVRAHK